MKVHIFNYLDVRKFVPSGPTIAIRIFDPYTSLPGENSNQPLQDSSHWVGVITSVFEDLDPRRFELAGHKDVADRIWAQNQTVFTADQALTLLNEFSEAINTNGLPEALVVHCNAGLSRSPAVAKAICELWGITPDWQPTRDAMMKNGHVGNLHVYETLKSVGERLSNGSSA